MQGLKVILSSIGVLAMGPVLAEGLYVGIGIGVTTVDEMDSRDGITIDDSPLGWRWIVGYEISEHLALEGAYVDAGEADGTLALAGIDFPPPLDFEADVSALMFSLVGRLPVNESAYLVGKLGYYDGELEGDIPGLADTIRIEEDGITVGAGIRLAFTESIALRGELDWYDTDIDTLWAISVGVQYGFGN